MKVIAHVLVVNCVILIAHLLGLGLHNSFVVGLSGQCDINQVKVVGSTSVGWDHFGWAVAVDADNSVIAAYNDNSLGANSGAAYVFDTVNRTEITKLVASDGIGGDFFGYSVDIRGTYILISAPMAVGGAGSVYLFVEVSLGNWQETQKFVASDSHVNQDFGSSVAIGVDTLFIGASLNDDNGFQSGAVYMYHEVSPNVWNEAKLLASDGLPEVWFGYSVDNDGTTTVIGAPQDDDIAEDSGAVYIFDEFSTLVWTEMTKLVADGGITEYFGQSVSISGTNLLIGAPFDSELGYRTGAAYFFVHTSPGNWIQLQKIFPAEISPGAQFGFDVAIDDPLLVISGVYGSYPNGYPSSSSIVDSGSVWFFVHENGTCTEFEKFRAFDAQPSDEVGSSVAIFNTTVLMGGRGIDDLGSNAGGAYFVDMLQAELCTDTICKNGGVCSTVADDYCDFSTVCDCDGTGFEPPLCKTDADDCLSSPCLNNGTCFDDGPNAYYCVCVKGWQGDVCEYDADDCVSSPCMNDGVCSDLGLNSFGCNCSNTEFEGEVCKTLVDDCASSPCLDGEICTDTGSLQYNCSDVDDCGSSPCENGGLCSDTGLNDFRCDCDGTGFKGGTCVKDVNDCGSAPCLHDGVCTDSGVNAFECNCSETGYVGDTCETNIDDCVTNACQNEAICIDGVRNYTCLCTMPGYEGEFCDIDIDDCTSNSCQNGGTCLDMLLGFFCDCTDLAYEGDLCEIYIPCLSIECQNGGTCEDDTCTCLAGYTGEFCETLPMIDGEPLVFTLSFDNFANDNDTAETFLLEIPILLSESIPGTSPGEFSVTLISADDQVIYEVTFINYQGMEREAVTQAAQDPTTPLADRIDGDVAVTAPIEEGDDEVKVKANDNGMFLIIILLVAGLCIIIAGVIGAKKYIENREKSNLKAFKADELAMPV